MPTGITVENGQDITCKTFLLALNHRLDQIRTIPEEFVIYGEYLVSTPNGPHIQRGEVGKVSLAEFDETDGYAVYPCLLSWRTGHEPRKIQIFYRSLDPRDTPHPIAASPLLPFDFWSAAWNPDPPSADQTHRDARAGKYWVDGPVSSPGRWNLAHPFAQIDDIAVIYLWRFAAPAFFEMHSHIESNHCSPLPPAWVHSSEFVAKLNPGELLGYDAQDILSPSPRALGEFGEIARNPTAEIGVRFGKDLGASIPQQVFPFLSAAPDKIGCIMPMDMEYMHFNGYFGIPISKEFTTLNTWTKGMETARWYCWDAVWKIPTNNVEVYNAAAGAVSKKFLTEPLSEQGEVWNWMEADDRGAYESWEKQSQAYIDAPSAPPPATRLLPFYHFEPRRYTPMATSSEDSNYSVNKALSLISQSSTCLQSPSFFGFKLYTALGWAPMDPFLELPLREFYGRCAADQIPLLNHCTPAGYFTHDRHHYFDLLRKEEKKGRSPKVAPGYEDKFGLDGWMSQFALHVPGPDGHMLSPKTTADKIWWFIHHYVSPQAWNPVLKQFPGLKLCLAHLGDSDHLADNSWETRKNREPLRSKSRHLALEFDGDQIDRSRTHRFLYDLLELIQPGNRVFVDLSYVILDEHNAAKFTQLFHWAKEHKPVLLERILWGTDWPLVGNTEPVKNLKEGNMLHRYAKSFREAVPHLPGDFFLRACFLNPLQYLDLKRIREKVGGGWDWIQDMDPQLFRADYQKDKVELLYRSQKTLAEELGG